jgi:alpha-N-acetylglucosaminidase
MKKTYLLLITLLATLPFISFAQKNEKVNSDKEIMAAKQVLMRTIGMKSSSFEFEKIPSENGLDVYEVIALSGKVQVKGSGTIAMTRGAYDYLQKACNIQYTWSSQPLIQLPKEFPDFTIPRTVSPYKLRQYYNVCTYGYSTAFWHFEDWEKELDWMALHGINMPLAMGGQEAIWQKVYKDMGITADELSAYFTGPAFLPWQRMGNLYKHDGPLPQSYIDQSMELQKQILTRMKQLGMTPIVPGFSGIVPAAYSRVNPAAQLREMKGWCNFPDENKSFILSPGTSDFTTLGKNFITEYKRNYGEVHYYLADLFNENEVPVTAEGKNDELALYGRSVSEAITAGDSEGIWVIQGWLFNNNQSFWDKNAVKAFLSQVPNEKMLIIDLANESFAGWQKHEAFYGKPWIYSTINNYGGNSQLGANLPFLATDAAAMLANPKKGNLVGFGISPEGIENNEAVYELLTQVAWTSKEINIKTYWAEFTLQRYGKTDNDINEAWLTLLGSVYGRNSEHALNLYQARPPYSSNVNIFEDPDFDRATALFVKSAENFKDSPLFKTDLALMVTQYAGNKVDVLLKRAMELHKLGLSAESQRAFGRAFELLLMMDGITSTMPDQRLERMIENARKYGLNKEESDYFEANAKRQLTQWGTISTPVLHEYASKVWSGLIRSYYLGRWNAYAKSLQTGEAIDLNTWEANWISKPGIPTKAPTTGDANKYAVTLYNAANEYITENLPQVKVTIKYAGANKSMVSMQPFESDYQVTYTTDGSAPLIGSKKYDNPFGIELPATVKAAAFNNNKMVGSVNTIKVPISFGKPVAISPMPSDKYKAQFGGTLTDAVKASENHQDGNWLGLEGDNLSATITLEGSYKVSKVTLSYLQNNNALIFAPLSVIVETSVDGKTYKSAGIYDLDENKWNIPANKGEVNISFTETQASHVRLLVINRGKCPVNHPASGKKAWLFVDEITVE